PEQKAYELLRPVVLFNESTAERAMETGTAQRSLYRKVAQFEEQGMGSLFAKEASDREPDKSRSLPPDMRQLIVDLKAEHPDFRSHEIATICFLRFGRKPSHHTVQRVLADGPRPSIPARRFLPYGQIPDPFKRRKVVVVLHAEGWSVSTIAAYMQTTRDTVYDILHRWAAEGYAGLEDKSRAPHNPARKVTMRDINEVKKLASNPDLGAYRVMAALEQIGIKLSRATCGRLLSLNRHLYGLPAPQGGAPRQRKEMPFKASFRHEYWSVDVRYIEKHRIPDVKGPVYLISILENYSRAVLASKISPTQNQWDYLEVLFAAFSSAGVPKAIVSDGGGIFYSNQAMDVYTALGIEKKRIDKGQAWENYIETHFNIVRRMADAKFALATSWEEMIGTHRKWMADYNSQRHWAHEKREDGCHSPAEVLGWHKGTMYPESVLDRILFATRYTRYLDKHGFLRFQNWKFYGQRGLAHQPVSVWVYEGTLKIEHQAVTLSKYTVELQEDRKHLKGVSNPGLAETPFRSPQLTLIDIDPHEWVLYWRIPAYAAARRRHKVREMVQLELFDDISTQPVVETEVPYPRLRLISPQKEL
ncbi:MAG: helix-turn-helix domain-containing protein, partial [Ktedonobacteraceae bacterium]